MVNILFVCLGNICRSPMAEFIFRDLVEKRGLSQRFSCASAATSPEERGNPVYPAAQKKLMALGIDPSEKRASPLCRADYDLYDWLIGMETRNIQAMQRICGGDPQHKIRRLLDDAPLPRDIADPWYTGDFDAACRDIQEGCQTLLASLLAREEK